MRKDTRKRLSILGVDGYARTYKEDGKTILTLEASYHHNMMTRATNENYKLKFPTYKDVSVSENFKNFKFFAEWCNNQVGFGELGWVLDKDTLIEGNKIYSENTCLFIPALINNYFVKRSKLRDLPTGVSWSQSENCYKVYCANLNGKNKTLGRFSDIEEASEVYRSYKNGLASILLDKYADEIDTRLRLKLKTIAGDK